jgi:hypothetical protein
VSGFCWATNDRIAVSTHSGSVLWFSLTGTNAILYSEKPLASRVKDVVALSDTLVVGISSAGDVVLWNSETGAELSRAWLDDRLICVSAVGNVAATGAPTVDDEEQLHEGEVVPPAVVTGGKRKMSESSKSVDDNPMLEKKKQKQKPAPKHQQHQKQHLAKQKEKKLKQQHQREKRKGKNKIKARQYK